MSNSFEGGSNVPLLGMEKFFDAHIGTLKLPNVHAWSTPGPASHSTTHGGFDDDARTRESVIHLIKHGILPK